MEEKEYKRAVEIKTTASELNTRLVSLSTVERTQFIQTNRSTIDLEVIKKSGDDNLTKQITAIEQKFLSDLKLAMDACLIRLKVEFETL